MCHIQSSLVVQAILLLAIAIQPRRKQNLVGKLNMELRICAAIHGIGRSRILMVTKLDLHLKVCPTDNIELFSLNLFHRIDFCFFDLIRLRICVFDDLQVLATLFPII